MAEAISISLSPSVQLPCWVRALHVCHTTDGDEKAILRWVEEALSLRHVGMDTDMQQGPVLGIFCPYFGQHGLTRACPPGTNVKVWMFLR